MRHALVRRVVLALVALLVGASALFAWRAGRPLAVGIAVEAVGSPSQGAAGAALFERHCADCHVAPDLAATLRGTPDPAAAATRLRAFLAVHGEASDAEDRAIVEFLSSGG